MTFVALGLRPASWLQLSNYLRLWEWREDKINLMGATQSITVRLRYEKILPLLAVELGPY